MRWASGGPVLVAALGCVCVLAGCSSASQTPVSRASPAPPTSVGTELDGPVPQSLLGLSLTDQAGRHVTLASWPGKIVVVSDMTTLCQETCAIGTAGMLQAARAVERAGHADDVEFVSITLDPRRDDQRHLAQYQRLFGPLPNWEVLTGSSADIDRLWRELGVWRRTVSLSHPYPRDWLTGQPLTYDIQHSDDLIFMDADQRFRFVIDGPGSVASANLIPPRILGSMDPQGRTIVRTPSSASWSATGVLRVVSWLIGDGAAT